MTAAIASAENRWVHIYRNDNKFNSFKLNEVKSLEYIDSLDHFTHINISTESGDTTHISMEAIEEMRFGTNIPTIRISLPDYPDKNEIWSKTEYVNAVLEVEGEDYPSLLPTELQIKGRGNSSWYRHPKKPYRLKFAGKVELPGLKPSKNFILIPNYVDCTHLRNSIAMWIANKLDIPYTHSNIPVRVNFNGIDKGMYMLSEKLGINKYSVNIPEETAILWEMDTNYDEEYKFITPIYNIKIQVKDPDLNEISGIREQTAEELFEDWKADFIQLEQAVAEGDFTDYIDINSLVNYILVYDICSNWEINHPKSTYFYKESKEDKYKIGPVWDFDWAFTFSGSEGKSPEQPLFLNPSQHKGSAFFQNIIKDERFITLFEERLKYFVEDVYPDLFEAIDEMAAGIEPAAKENGLLWPMTDAADSTFVTSFNHHQNVETLKQWIRQRVAFIIDDSSLGLF